MSAPGNDPVLTVWRQACAALLSIALLLAAALVVASTDRLPVPRDFTVPWYALLVLYVLAGYFTLGFQRREGSVLVVLVQLPLALGVVLVAPTTHLAVRLLAVGVVDLVLRRRGALKTIVNLAVAGLEVGIAAGVLSLIGPSPRPGPSLWGALLLVLLLAEVASQLCLNPFFWVLGVPRTRRDLLEPLAVEVITTTVFAGVAVLTLASAWTDPSTLVVVAVLTGALVLSYRAYRRLAAQQRATEELYAFVKVLEPVDVETPPALLVLENVRELLHAKRLELAVADSSGGLGRCLSVQLDRPAVVRESRPEPLSDGPDLSGERMTTPLVVGGAFLGLLTAQHRITSDRGFDMKDLRLFETVATELATAIDRGRLLRDLERAASTDPMTGLPNLHRVTQVLADLLGRHEGVLVAAVAVDSFREINDTLGHEVGDALLREVATRLHAAWPAALIGRIGGGRFAVAVPAGLAGGDAGMFGLGLRSQVEGSAQLGPVSTHVRLSVGCARAPEHGADASTLLRRAETAMYSARAAHGGPVLWEPAYEVQGVRRLAVVTALREALAAGAIGVAFQAKINVRTGVVTGVEALARWTHPALGEIDPVEFVPLAQAAGLMGQLTSTVLRQSLAACQAWQCDVGEVGSRPVGVSVNVSSDTLQSSSFVTEVASALRRAGVAAGLLTLELTEDVVVADPDLAAERMHELQALGVRLSVDDFGTGYSSLTYLKGLPINEVKIDKGFVDGLVGDAGDQAVVRAVVDIAHTLGLVVVAEGVENEDQQRLLRSLGVDEVQGFLHARPVPALEMATWLRRRSIVGRPG